MNSLVKQLLRKASPVLIICIILYAVYLAYQINTNLKVNIIDVGQGDSILIKSPDNKYLLVDGGPSEGVLAGMEGLIPFWIKEIDGIILTHPDLDHVGGLPEVIKRYKIGKIYYVPFEAGNSSYKEFEKLLKEKQINTEIVDEKDDFMLGCCVVIDFLWPEQEIPITEEGKDPNDFSVTFKLKYKNFQGFFGGDLPSKYEEEVCTKHPMDVDVLKIGHHGSLSSTSEKFLSCIKPEVALISVGEGNKYGHPDREVLKRLNEKSIIILDTSKQGTISLVTDGENLWFIN